MKLKKINFVNDSYCIIKKNFFGAPHVASTTQQKKKLNEFLHQKKI
jgi:hypothetical protein